MTTRHREPTLPPTRPLAILDAAGRPLWAALGGPGYAYDDRLEALWRAGQRAARGDARVEATPARGASERGPSGRRVG